MVWPLLMREAGEVCNIYQGFKVIRPPNSIDFFVVSLFI